MVVRNVERVRARIRTPLILENITASLIVPGSEMDEIDFINSVLDRTGCGLLCDVTNLYINAMNHGQDLEGLLAKWPWHHVVQLHVAGGHWHKETLVDSHAHPIAPEVWRVLETAVAKVPLKGIILERDENLPPFSELLGELEQARAIMRRTGRWV